MSETNAGQGLSVQEALATLEQARTYEEPLRRRSEGATWMVWGLVTAALQLSFDALGEGVRAWWPYWALVIAWPLVGVATTYAIWNIAGVHTQHLEGNRRRSLLGGLLWLPAVYAVWALLALLGPGIQETAFPLLAVGGGWVLLGATNLFRTTAFGRRVLLACGLVILAAGLVVAYLAPGSPHQGWPMAGAVMVLVGGGAPFLGGLIQSLRG